MNKAIRFGDGYTARRTRYCWVLEEAYEGKDKMGNTKQQRRETYHATLPQVCGYVLDRSAGECSSLSEIIDLMKGATSLLSETAEAA